MKPLITTLLVLVAIQSIFAQEGENPKFYLGLSYGTSYSLGDFSDTDIANPDAGFAKDGRRFDIYGGIFLNKKGKTTVTGLFRFQSFETEIEDLIETFKADNPGVEFTGTTEDWRVYSLLVGLAQKISITRKLDFFPRFGLGPLFATSPGITVDAPNRTITNGFVRESKTGAGLGYEIGIGLRTDLGKRFSLLPTFTFSGGIVNINDVTSTTDNIAVTRDYQPRIRSFNLGLSVGYRFY